MKLLTHIGTDGILQIQTHTEYYPYSLMILTIDGYQWLKKYQRYFQHKPDEKHQIF